MKIKYSAVFVISLLNYAYAAPEIATCTIDAQGGMKGSYNAIQGQAYNPSCILKTASGLYVVPIGNNAGSIPRVTLLAQGGQATLNKFDSIELQLFGAEDNTLGKRGRQEIASCFITEEEFKKLPEGEQQFRRKSSDFYHGCQQQGRRTDSYDFYIKFNSTPQANYKNWDMIFAQMHAQNDKNRYCIPGTGIASDICNQNNGRVATIERTVAAYDQALRAGGIFEADLQPPISFRLKDGYFSIVLFSSLVDAAGNKTRFSPGKNCSQNVNKAEVGKVKKCSETGATTTVAWRQALDETMPANEYIYFRINVTWPDFNDNLPARLNISYQNPVTGQMKELVNDNGTIPFGAYDDAFPYFKAGVYRQNGNIIPTAVELYNLRRL